MSVADSAVDLERTLRERFGLERFRPGQRAVIESVLGRRDVLCVMPTGGGKSLCYQLPAVLLEGVTLVVSPLIALMKDQVDALTARGLRATFINSTLDPSEVRLRLLEVEGGRYDLVYVAPERFRSGRFVEAMARLRPALLAVDEAHCISEWGHDFRPDYARLGQARRALGMPPCIALTATATDLVRRDVADQLDLREPAQFVTGFDRPNLSYSVVVARREDDKRAALAEILGNTPGPAIVYASSRKRCEEVAGFLSRALRREAVIYHAGLTREERTEAQDRFMGGDAGIVVATNAFGMGVDKADIRAVVHYNMPGTLEAYYQEAGRAGRDGLPARCVLLFAHGDRFLQELFIENEYPPREAVFAVYDFLRTLDADPIELTQAEIKESLRLELNESAVGTALRLLEGAGALERFRPRENMAIVRINAEPDEPSLVDRLSPQAHTQRLVLTALEGLVNRRFGEPVYFHPDEFATKLGLDRTALSRALRHLTAELPVDYVPPFRGNALRILDRHRRARDLSIDFSALRQRKEQEYEKLERMVRYAQGNQCRRSYILGYFGDVDGAAGRCGRCDVCGPDGEPPAAGGPATVVIDTPAGRETLLKILSGVARTKGRFGKTAVAQMLVGSGAEKLARAGLTRLSTFGILERSGLNRKEVAEVLDALTAAGLVESQEVDRFKPVIGLTAAGWEWLRGRAPTPLALPLDESLGIKLRLGGLDRLSSPGLPPLPPPAEPSEAEPAPDASPPEAPDADPLRERLRLLRLQLARESKLSPAYVFSNETLDLLVHHRPRTPHALATIKGIGPSKLERYGAALLAEIAASSAPAPLAPPPPEVPPPAPSPAPTVPDEVPPRRPSSASSYVPTEEWTCRLLDRGFTADEAAAIRGLEPSTILRHASTAARQGRSVRLDAFLPPATLARWADWHRLHGDAPPPPEPGVPADVWGLFLERVMNSRGSAGQPCSASGD